MMQQFMAPTSKQCEQQKDAASFRDCKNCHAMFLPMNSPHCTKTKRHTPKKHFRMGNEVDYCSVDCQSSHSLKTMFVYQDLKHMKQMHDRGEGMESAENAGDFGNEQHAEREPREMTVNVGPEEEVWNGLAQHLQDRCRISPSRSPSKPSAGKMQRGNLFHEYRLSSNNAEDFGAASQMDNLEHTNGEDIAEYNVVPTSWGSASSANSLDGHIEEGYFSYPRQ